MSALWVLLKANWLTVLKDAAILGLVAFVAYRIYTDGQNSIKAGDLKSLQAEVAQQAKTLEGWRKDQSNAQAQLSSDLARIAAAPPIVHDWVRESPPSAQPSVLPTTPGQACHTSTESGGAEPGPRDPIAADRRDLAVAEFKRKFETALAECRSLDASWPQL